VTNPLLPKVGLVAHGGGILKGDWQNRMGDCRRGSSDHHQPVPEPLQRLVSLAWTRIADRPGVLPDLRTIPVLGEVNPATCEEIFEINSTGMYRPRIRTVYNNQH